MFSSGSGSCTGTTCRSSAARAPTAAGSSTRGRSSRSSRSDRDRRAYLFEVDGGPVGFGLVGRVTSGPKLMFEFFVVRAMRGQGVGRAAAEALFALHPGIWEIPFQEENPAAARFWRGVAAHAARDGVREERRPVPGKPEIPHDVWLTVAVG